MISLPNSWAPREYQGGAWKFLERGGKRVNLVWHRRAGKDDVGAGVGHVHVGVGVGEGGVGVGVGVGVEEGQDTQNTFCLAAPCSPVNVQKSL